MPAPVVDPRPFLAAMRLLAPDDAHDASYFAASARILSLSTTVTIAEPPIQSSLYVLFLFLPSLFILALAQAADRKLQGGVAANYRRACAASQTPLRSAAIDASAGKVASVKDAFAGPGQSPGHRVAGCRYLAQPTAPISR